MGRLTPAPMTCVPVDTAMQIWQLEPTRAKGHFSKIGECEELIQLCRLKIKTPEFQSKEHELFFFFFLTCRK